MKYIYILGLEHSGTTLTDYLLSKLPNAIGLGEVASFFRPEHMRSYMAKWGDYDDVRLCSCGSEWSDCEFWAEISNLNGLESEIDIIEKYNLLFKHLKSKFSEDVVIIDSSKNIETIQEVLDNRKLLGLSIHDIKIVFSIKAPEEFAMSIVRKQSKQSLVSIIHAYNWWFGSNKQMLEFCRDNSELVSVSSYLQLCNQPLSLIKRIATEFELETEKAPSLTKASNSHIAMGNKNFTMRNKDHITYDDEWRSNWRIGLVSLLHFRAKKLYKTTRDSLKN